METLDKKTKKIFSDIGLAAINIASDTTPQKKDINTFFQSLEELAKQPSITPSFLVMLSRLCQLPEVKKQAGTFSVALDIFSNYVRRKYAQ